MPDSTVTRIKEFFSVISTISTLHCGMKMTDGEHFKCRAMASPLKTDSNSLSVSRSVMSDSLQPHGL